MNSSIGISVIVPVFKAERYIHKCLDSLVSQTFENYEILLIDDGSPDKSGEICDEYAKKNKRIKVIHKKNGGVSSARQCGLDSAVGEYVIHVDPDDWVESNMLCELYDNAYKDDCDILLCDYYQDCNRQSMLVKQQPSNLNHDIVLKELFHHLHGSCWNKLVKRSLFQQYSISFPLDLSFSEDLYVNCCLLMNNVKVSYLARAFSDQLEQGEDYMLAKKVISINLMEENYHLNNFQILNNYGFVNKFNYGRMKDEYLEMYLVRLDKVNKMVYNKLESRFLKWLKFIKAGSVEEMEKIAKGDENMERALAFMERFVNDEEVRGIYDKINDVERDAKERGMAEGLAEGKAKGLAEGLAEGLIQGKTAGIIQTAKNMLKMNFKIEDIMEVTGLSIEEIETLQ